jgi:ABC-type uncharacterized transport system permease subunit
MTVTPSAVADAEESLAAPAAQLLPSQRRSNSTFLAAILVALLAAQVCWLTALGYAIWLIA